MFVDRVRVHLRAGNGGAGVVSFARTRGRPQGRPLGGSGGWGGDVIVRADPSVSTLLGFRHHPHQAGGDGTHGQGELKHGRRGLDRTVLVPLGTVIIDEHGVMLADLVATGQQATVLKGGRGGRGNAAFLSPTNRAPHICEQGEFGPGGWFTFEMKLIADAALIGFPNAGKSSLISKVSAAKPKIADYPFTTLEPHLGVVAIDNREFVIADIPGLIEGAADGRGLGHEFLRHVERARALVVLLDPSSMQTLSPADQLEVLLKELAGYSPELPTRPRLVAINKADLPEAAEAGVELPEAVLVSAMTGEGVKAFLHRVADLVELADRAAPERPGFILHRPSVAGFAVRKEGSTWIVEGASALRAVGFADLTLPEAADRSARNLARLGVDRALAEAGARPGDEVRIGDVTFEFELPASEVDQ